MDPRFLSLCIFTCNRACLGAMGAVDRTKIQFHSCPLLCGYFIALPATILPRFIYSCGNAAQHKIGQCFSTCRKNVHFVPWGDWCSCAAELCPGAGAGAPFGSLAHPILSSARPGPFSVLQRQLSKNSYVPWCSVQLLYTCLISHLKIHHLALRKILSHRCLCMDVNWFPATVALPFCPGAQGLGLDYIFLSLTVCTCC